jgi:carboxypeptidase PM20D1
MRKLRKLLLSLLVLGLIALAAIFAANTISFASKQIVVEPVEPLKVSHDALERLAEAVKIRTVSFDREIDSVAFRRLDTFFQKNFPLVDSLLEKEIIGEFSRVYKWQGQNTRLSPILLLAHTDVVPVEESSLKKWKVPPFHGEIKDDYIWGRGTLDDKVSVCGILEAIELLLQVDYSPQRTVYVAFGHDEETSGEHGAKRIAALMKQQGLRFEFVLDEGSLVLEDALDGLDKPLALIGVAEKGYATLELSVNLQEGGHSSMPPSDAAINLLSTAIVRLKNNPPPANIEGTVRQMLEHTGPEMSLFQKVIFANLNWTHLLVEWQMSKAPASNAMLRTTLAPTMLSSGFKENVLPTRASAKVNCRILPGETVASVTDYIRRTIDDDRVTVTLNPGSQASEPPAVSGTETAGYRILETTVKQVFPEAVVAPSLVIGATDSRHYQALAENTYRFLPIRIDGDDLKRFHGIDERLGVEQYRQAVRFYRQLILNACK